MADLSPSKVQAVTVLRGLQKHLAPLYPPTPSASASGRPPIYLPALPRFTAGERSLVGLWKAYLKWEESNPLEIEEKDRSALVARVQGVYRRALIRMRFYSEIWYVFDWLKREWAHLRDIQVYGVCMDEQRRETGGGDEYT